MTILIAPIGVDTNHVKNWLREVSSDAEILWLIHSKKNSKHDFPKITKDLVKDIKKMNDRLEIKLKVIDSALSVEPTFDAITEIIKLEENENKKLIRKEFILNITGGTNVMGAATMVAATFLGTRANYIIAPQPGDPRGTKYVIDLPVKPISSARMKEIHKKILGIITNNNYIIENTPIDADVIPIEGIISRRELLEKIGWNISKSSTLNGITEKLAKDGMIEVIPYTEYYVLPNKKRLNSGEKLERTGKSLRIRYSDRQGTFTGDRYAEWPLDIEKNHREAAFKITALGKFTSKHSMMLD